MAEPVTHETKHLINVADVSGVDFECKQCRARISLPADATRVLLQCPSCNADWILPNTDEHNAIQTLLAVFKKTERALQGRPFSLRLQITSLPDAP